MIPAFVTKCKNILPDAIPMRDIPPTNPSKPTRKPLPTHTTKGNRNYKLVPVLFSTIF